MNNNENKIVRISNWYLLTAIPLLIVNLLFVFIFFFLAGIALTEGNLSQSGLIGLWITLFFGLGICLNTFLYWKSSGIYINSNGDHIVKIGGVISKEDKLLNGVIRTNQVERGPFDQLFGMAKISTGLFGNKKLSGVVYKDIKNYDQKMRGNLSNKINTLF